MPIVNSKYKNPGWENNTSPAIDEDELNALSDTVESLDAERGQSPVLKGNVEVQGQGGDTVISLTTTLGARKITVSPNTDDAELALAQDNGNVANNPVLVHGIATPETDTDAANKDYVDSAVSGSADTKMDKVNPTGSGYMTLAKNGDQPSGITLEDGTGSISISPDGSGNLYLAHRDTSGRPPAGGPVELYNLATPTFETSAVPKSYVDGIKESIKNILLQIAGMLATAAYDDDTAADALQTLDQLIELL